MLRIAASLLHKHIRNDAELTDTFVRYQTAFIFQVSQSVACNGLHQIEQRCCRWLLMTHDRVERDDLPLTHESLAMMLGVRGPSVTQVLHSLEDKRLVSNQRGVIRSEDRKGLEATSCECYSLVQNEFNRLLPQALQNTKDWLRRN